MSIAEFYIENGLGEDYDIDDWLRDSMTALMGSVSGPCIAAAVVGVAAAGEVAAVGGAAAEEVSRALPVVR
jgi:hypothetical protein